MKCFVPLCAIWIACSGVNYDPAAYTLVDVTSLNGSDASGGCPSNCISNTLCDCTGIMSDLSSAALIDDVVPTLDLNMRDTWASDLFTSDTNSNSYAIGFRFEIGFVLREVELYVFFCPAWNIPRTVFLLVAVHRSLSYPSFIPSSGSPLGNVTLTRGMQNCESLTRIFIPVQSSTARTNYFIEFSSTSGLEHVYIGEVKFSDQVSSIISYYVPLTTSAVAARTPQTSLTTKIFSLFDTTIKMEVVNSDKSDIIPTTNIDSLITTTSVTVPTIANSTSSSTTFILVGVIICLVIIFMSTLIICGFKLCFKKTQNASTIEIHNSVRNKIQFDENPENRVTTLINEAYGCTTQGGQKEGEIELKENEAYATISTNDNTNDQEYEYIT